MKVDARDGEDYDEEGENAKQAKEEGHRRNKRRLEEVERLASYMESQRHESLNGRISVFRPKVKVCLFSFYFNLFMILTLSGSCSPSDYLFGCFCWLFLLRLQSWYLLLKCSTPIPHRHGFLFHFFFPFDVGASGSHETPDL